MRTEGCSADNCGGQNAGSETAQDWQGWAYAKLQKENRSAPLLQKDTHAVCACAHPVEYDQRPALMHV
jgi:hypothetical protein